MTFATRKSIAINKYELNFSQEENIFTVLAINSNEFFCVAVMVEGKGAGWRWDTF
jgi:hypothetical protein